MTYALRQSVLCDGIPGMVCGIAYGRDRYNVQLLSGPLLADVTGDRLRVRPEVVTADRITRRKM